MLTDVDILYKYKAFVGLESDVSVAVKDEKTERRRVWLVCDVVTSVEHKIPRFWKQCQERLQDTAQVSVKQFPKSDQVYQRARFEGNDRPYRQVINIMVPD